MTATPVVLVCIPRGHGKTEYGHVWTSDDPDAMCQCGQKRFTEDVRPAV